MLDIDHSVIAYCAINMYAILTDASSGFSSPLTADEN